jgi:hypothetical protein
MVDNGAVAARLLDGRDHHNGRLEHARLAQRALVALEAVVEHEAVVTDGEAERVVCEDCVGALKRWKGEDEGVKLVDSSCRAHLERRQSRGRAHVADRESHRSRVGGVGGGGGRRRADRQHADCGLEIVLPLNALAPLTRVTRITCITRVARVVLFALLAMIKQQRRRIRWHAELG